MKIEVLCHSSIRIEKQGLVIYADPFKIKESKKDSDIIIITHSHYDHFSEEDILKIKNEKTKIFITQDLLESALDLGFKKENITVVMPNNLYKIYDIQVSTIPAYNINKKFHPKEYNWVGYILNIENKKIYIAGDTDITDENKKIVCDIALVPVGGTYTMTHSEAADLINIINPDKAIPTHYGDIVGELNDGIEFSKLVNNEINVDIQIK